VSFIQNNQNQTKFIKSVNFQCQKVMKKQERIEKKKRKTAALVIMMRSNEKDDKKVSRMF
jgi:hypothetical protein